jgi:hypothetical protein
MPAISTYWECDILHADMPLGGDNPHVKSSVHDEAMDIRKCQFWIGFWRGHSPKELHEAVYIG